MNTKITVKKNGYTFEVEANNALEALDKIKKSHPGHPILSDYQDGLPNDFHFSFSPPAEHRIDE